jgi:hypothetical protein
MIRIRILWLLQRGVRDGYIADLKDSKCGDFEEELMVTKRVSPVKKNPKRKTVASELTDSAVMGVLESESGAAGLSSIDPEDRRRLVAAEAYFLAERRGFAAGNEVEDWVAAEAAVDSRLQQQQVA